MRIIQTPPGFYRYSGGVENYVLSLSRELSKLGQDVSIICASERDLDDTVVDGILIKRLGCVGKLANTNITLKLPYVLLKENFDIMHTHLPTPWSADWSAITSRIKSRPLVLTYHNDITGFGTMDYIAKLYNTTMLQFVLSKADAIITSTNRQLKSPLLRNYSKKIKVIPPGVDTDKFKPARVEKIENSIFFLSILDNYHKYKGLEYLIKALRLVREEIKDVKLTVGGDGNLLNYYKEMVVSLGLGGSVEFTGYIPEERILEYYNKHELFVLPSISPIQEGFGIVLLEAMACGIPVVTTNVVGLSEDIEHENAGVVVEPRDVKSLAEAIIKILKNKKNGRNARKLSERYEWSKTAKKILGVYLDVMHNYE